MSDGPLIRPAQRDDVPLLLEMIRELAEYERAAEQAIGTDAQLDEALFGARPAAEAVIAELGQAPVGFALFFPTFSTWLCRPGLWLEDLYVRPQARRAGVGEALLRHLAQLGSERGCGRIEWSALHWNEPAIRFYEKLGAERLHEWQGFRLTGETLRLVAGP